MNIHDHGQNDAIEFNLGSWSPVARASRYYIEQITGRELTTIPLPKDEVSDED
jgi:hypothetical protein